MLNLSALNVFRETLDQLERLGGQSHVIAGATVLDLGAKTSGSLEAGLLLARLCLGDLAQVSLVPTDRGRHASDNLVYLRSDDPVMACLGGQYAGWPVQTDDFFAMGSGPARMKRGREEMLQTLALSESPRQVVAVLESDQLPTESAVKMIAEQTQSEPADVHLAVASSTSLAGSLQVVARSIETALHKLHELKFDVRRVVSATGQAPLPPPARRGDMIAGIGRTNDAILYGATVTLWTDEDDDKIDAVASQVPSQSSSDHGRPFAEIFRNYDHDFYKVDPLLFSPAVVTFHSLRSGKTWRHGKLEPALLEESFHA